MKLSLLHKLDGVAVQDLPAKVVELYGEGAYLKRIGGEPCSLCNNDIHSHAWRVALKGCETCERIGVHDPDHFRCNHGAHCTRDFCW